MKSVLEWLDRNALTIGLVYSLATVFLGEIRRFGYRRAKQSDFLKHWLDRYQNFYGVLFLILLFITAWLAIFNLLFSMPVIRRALGFSLMVSLAYYYEFFSSNKLLHFIKRSFHRPRGL